jgi:hypothetical protein
MGKTWNLRLFPNVNGYTLAHPESNGAQVKEGSRDNFSVGFKDQFLRLPMPPLSPGYNSIYHQVSSAALRTC